MSKKKVFVDYRSLKEYLNPYVKFSFKMPRRGKDFTPAQKAAITRQFKKYGKIIRAHKLGEASFLKKTKEKIPGTLKTNKGVFFNYPNAKPVKNKKMKITLIETKFGKRRELYAAFPRHIINDLDKIDKFVNSLIAKYRPDYVRWATPNQQTSHVYDPSIYKLYAARTFSADIEEWEGEDVDFFIGIFLGFDPNLR